MIRLYSLALLGFLLVACKQSQATLTSIQGKQINITDSIASDLSVIEYIAPYKKRIDEEMNAILAYAPESLSKSDGPYNTAIGNMMADAVLEFCDPVFFKRSGKHIDGVVLNHGGIRSVLRAGNVTMGTAYEIMPFENSIVVVEISSDEARAMFQYLKSGKAHPIANMQLILNANDDIDSALINGKPIENGKTYFIATNDYLQQGGDGMVFFTNPKTIEILDYKMRTILIDHFKKQDTIAPKRDTRFIKK
ncbi:MULTISPECIES: 5'-nucleotidase C-terminal domain-containing protein [unclassified Leeuwenhoekiella]|uniref:5'-nucleotidase C-terminal domain-containing protein n=1 Tax=unclassified Leeuwenhoekiella TaxID=2615029 RepID=UPI00048E7E25|nr:5'-nucleotidase [Leeuwenhoekiella sp. MAR_2009_132]